MRLHWPLINLALLFLAPAITAWYLLYFTDYRNIHTIQHGSFIQSPQKLVLRNIEYLDGQNFEHKWSLVYVLPEHNSTALQRQVLHNLYISLGPERDRVAIITTTATEIEPKIASDTLLILDPHGLYIMQYSGIVDHSGLLKDLRRLLKYSHV